MSTYEQYKKFLQSGAPAALTSGALAAGLARGPAYNKAPLKPSTASCAAFGGIYALGAWMIYDGDYRNGSGFIATWSAIYTLVNGKSLLKGGLYSKSMTALVLFTGINYANEFIQTPPYNREGVLAEQEANSQ